MYNKTTRAGITLRPRKEQNTMNDILNNALEKMSVEEKKELIYFLDFLISAQETREPQGDSPG